MKSYFIKYAIYLNYFFYFWNWDSAFGYSKFSRTFELKFLLAYQSDQCNALNQIINFKDTYIFGLAELA